MNKRGNAIARMREVRGEGGSLYDAFRERRVATVGWNQLAVQYEADRASIPLAMWTLDHVVVCALIEHYDATDAGTKRIVPLKRLYWPA